MEALFDAMMGSGYLIYEVTTDEWSQVVKWLLHLWSDFVSW